MNFPPPSQQFPLYEDDPERNLRTYSDSSDDSEEIQQKSPQRLIEDLKPYQTMRLNKQIPNISQ